MCDASSRLDKRRLGTDVGYDGVDEGKTVARPLRYTYDDTTEGGQGIGQVIGAVCPFSSLLHAGIVFHLPRLPVLRLSICASKLQPPEISECLIAYDDYAAQTI